jgi:hypothetical protein
LPNASFDDFYCPGPAESPRWDGLSLGWLESLDHYGLGPGVPSSEEDQVENGYFDGLEWALDAMELEIPEEVTQVSPESTPNSDTSSSTSTTEDLSSQPNHSPAEEGREGPSSSDAGSIPASNDTTSADEWLCEYPDCGQSFTHRHKLKYVYDTPQMFSTSRPLTNITKPT